MDIPHDSAFEIGQLQARRLTESGRQKTKRGNTIAKQMKVQSIDAQDEMIPVVELVIADSTTGVIFCAELSKTLGTNGMLMKLMQGIINPPTNEQGYFHEVGVEKVIDIANIEQKCQYTLLRKRVQKGESKPNMI